MAVKWQENERTKLDLQLLEVKYEKEQKVTWQNLNSLCVTNVCV